MLNTRAELLGAGVSRGVLAGPKFETVIYGIHAPAVVEKTFALRCEALLLVVPDGVLSHQTAAQLHGLPLSGAHEALAITVAPPKNPPRRKGVKGYERALTNVDVVERRGLRMTSPARTFADLAGHVSARDLVAIGDVMLRRGLADRAELDTVVKRLCGRRPLAAVRWALPRLDPAAASPPESWLRLRFEEAGLPQPRCNVPIFDAAGGLIATVDYLFEQAMIVVEYEGPHHLNLEQFRRDTLRDRLLVSLGYVVLRATSRDLSPSRTDLFDVVRKMLIERSSWRPN